MARLEFDDDDEFRFNDALTHEGHMRQNGISTWFGIKTAIMVSYGLEFIGPVNTVKVMSGIVSLPLRG